MRRLLLLLAALLLPISGGRAQAPTASSAKATEPTAIDELYKGGKARDPFAKVDGTGTQAPEPDASASDTTAREDFSIHSLVLKGIMQDSAGAYAVLVDPKYNLTFVLKKGRLFNPKNKPVPGVTGVIKPKQKMVQLITTDKDVQILILGESEAAENL